MASSSSSSSPSPPPVDCPHDVFLSFRGEDVRLKFRSHFLKELDRKLITFKDDEMEKGRSIAPELIKAIKGSRISIIAFSKNFPSSSWCLDELVEIMNCREERGLIVIPIFYEVDPSHVKKQSDGFGVIFDKTCEGRSEEQILRWRLALTNAATVVGDGEDSRNWTDEAKRIEIIVNDVSNKLNSTESNDFADFVGIDNHMKKMNSFLNLESDKVIMVGIWGPSGVGKTTIGRALFSQLSCQFPPRVFIDKTKENYTRANNSDDYNTKLYLQTQFLSEILDQKDLKIHGLGAVEERLGHKKVLVVFDDVDDQVLLKALVGKTTWFGPGSRIVVISKDRELLKDCGIEYDCIYEVGFPPKELAFQMFCRCAFGQDSPPDGFMDIAIEAARLTENLPLCLSVLGSSLRGIKKEDWADRLPKLRNSMAGQIVKTLRDSYDRLENDHKALFRHIACLFNHKPRDYVMRLLGDRKLDVGAGLDTLAERCLIQISEDNIIRMHDFLQKMGREIVRQQEQDIPGKRQFLMDSKEISDVLVDGTGTNSVLGIFLNLSEIEDTFSIDKKEFTRMKNLRFLSIYGVLQEDIEVLLDLHGGKDIMCKDIMWRQLRLLEWWGCSMRCMPPNFRPENLVELRMPDSHLEELWAGVQLLKCLKKMDLRRSKKLKKFPDLSKATNLEELYLGDCWSLKVIPPSIQNLNKLKKLDMKRCKNLQGLPTSIDLKSLYSLNLSGCSQLKTFPQISRNVSSLFLDETEVEEVPGGIEYISGLNYILLNGCSSLKYISPNILKLKDLEVIFFSNSDFIIEESDSPSAEATTTDNIHTQLADASSSCNWKHDVYLSFCGKDVRRTLISYLYQELSRKGITAYKADELMRSPEAQDTEIQHVIRESKIAIVVLSNNYASSTWCLDELVEIIKCKKEIGLKVIPIFYGVDPGRVKNQIPDLVKTFKKMYTVDKQEKWVQAFSIVNQLLGLHSRDWGSDAELIQKMVDLVSVRLNITPKTISPSALATATDNIHTQLADAPSSCNWKHDVFLSFRGNDVRRTLVSYLYQELSRKGITTFKDELLSSKDMARLLRNGIRESRIAIVVLSKNYASSRWCLDELVEIIKCREEIGLQVIPIFYGGDPVHMRKQILDLTEDKQQIWMQAFTVVNQLMGYRSQDWDMDIKMIERIVDDISFGLTITPKKLSDVAAVEMLPGIRNTLDKEIEKTLIVHYDGLKRNEKALFRHIACFLNNETYDNVTRVLEESELDVRVGLKILFDKSLIQISEERVICMHDGLQQLGRKIVLGPFIHQPAKRQFLMDTSEGCNVLIDQTGTEDVFGISFKVAEMEETLRRDERFKGLKKLQFMRMCKESLYGKEVRLHLVKGLHSLRHRLNNT